MDKNLSVSIVIPNWNGRRLLEKNLPQVMNTKKNLRNRIKEIIIVDDGSKDDSVSFTKQSYSREVKLIKHTKNRGFSAAVNTGARTAKSPLICLLNTDVNPSKDFLESAISHFEDENVFAVSLHEEGYGAAKGKFENGFIIHEPFREENEVKETFWVNGGSGVFRRNIWMDLGGMDEKLLSPFYWEDVDLSYRALKRGFILLWESKAFVYHGHEETMKKIPQRLRQKIQERNQLIFIWKNLTSPILFRKHIFGLFKRLSKNPGYLLIVLFALIKIGEILRSRKKELKEAKISDEAIFAKFTEK